MNSILSFTVPGLPPKKDGASSMWRKPAEIPRIKALRLAAHQAMDGRGPLHQSIELRVLIFASPRDGDLDNFITGIFDGLQAAHRRAQINLADWLDLPVGALPPQNILFTDDRWVERIAVERLPVDAEGPHYYVEVFRY